ncbi:MAG: hypothetical protein EP330_20160 [Deltaproteobacteria bacterium]|nr:MAG: hypothetical protein EP330_20160 [Deltaproteobacteria bacterium]
MSDGIIAILGVVATLGLSVGGIATLVLAEAQRRRIRSRWGHELAAHLASTWVTDHVEGQRDERWFWVFPTEHHVDVVVQLLERSDAEVRRGVFAARLDPALTRRFSTFPEAHCTGDADAERALFGHAPFVEAIEAATDFELAGDMLRVRFRTDASQSERALDFAMYAAECAEDALAIRWQQIGAQLGLSHGRNQLLGELDDIAVHVHVEDARTVVTAKISPPLRSGGIASGSGGMVLRDPVLDGRVAVDGEVASRLGTIDDETREALMECFHQFPESRAADDQVALVIPGRPVEGLGDHIHSAVRVARALSRVG